jgi:hypothetical protein
MLQRHRKLSPTEARRAAQALVALQQAKRVTTAEALVNERPTAVTGRPLPDRKRCGSFQPLDAIEVTGMCRKTQFTHLLTDSPNSHAGE